MSDHWNSLANLLGTPSLSPQAKKSTEGTATKTKEISPPETNMEVEPTKATTKEPSKLRSGWDAVTSFFGIQSASNTESKSETESLTAPAVIKQPSTSAKDARGDSRGAGNPRGSKRNAKPSFWTEDAEQSVTPSEPQSKLEQQTQAEDRSLTGDVFSSAQEEPVVSFGGRKRERNDRKDSPRQSRPPREPAEKAESPRESTVFSAPPVSTTQFESDDLDGPVERRSQRRAPRRGRSDDLDEGATPTPSSRRTSERRDTSSTGNRRPRSTEPVREVGSEEPVTKSEEPRENRRPARADRDRSERDRSERDRSERDRPELDRSERDRASRDQPGRERGERGRINPNRAERVDRDGIDREDKDRTVVDRDTLKKDGEERESGRRGRDRRKRNDESRTEPDRRRSDSMKRPPVEEVGFGAGLRDSDDDLDDVIIDDSDLDSLETDSPERATEGSRRGRNPRRGRRSSGRSTTGAEDAERMEADETEKKFIKVPSWIEALDGILQSNMDNHQRGNHGRDRNRGRGPRTNDR